MSEKGHRQLKVWQQAMDLAEKVHRVTLGFPREELYGLVSQMRRCVVSIPSNVAEGYGRGGKDYARFVSIAYGSLLELETQIELAHRFGYIDEATIKNLLGNCAEVGKMLNGLRKSLIRSFSEPRTPNPEPRTLNPGTLNPGTLNPEP
jgi:four helix bundle protein